LSGFHLTVLSVIFEIQGSLASSDRLRGIEIPEKVPVSIAKIKSTLNLEETLLLEISCVDLHNLGLIIDWHYLRSVNTNVQENYCLSDSGLRFFQFLKMGQVFE
jgi:hypothetical protein